jgi:integrase
VTTCARIKANRQNSTRSTGPRTKSGKARSSQNAKKHSLTLPLHLIPSLEPEVEALARLIVPDDAASVCYEAARGVAEAQIDLRRVKATGTKTEMPFRRFRFHDLRHLHSVEYLKVGGSLYDLSKRLGHTSVKTTEIYLDFLTGEEAATARAGRTSEQSQHAGNLERF